jgi:FlaA1/EpsC-like NDP-sugar epimerase
VLGAVHTARAAAAVDARFILISTDKAAEPHSVMGATKRLAELSVLDDRTGGGAIAVRFGNVLGSSGSVVEILMESARSGRALTVTDPGATRFFMTASEAASLVLKAAISGCAGDVFWLDMGSPLRLSDLVERILDVATPSGAARPAIVVTGLRPGEKRNEELTTLDLAMEATHDPGVWKARQPAADSALAASIEELGRACAAGDAAHALRVVEAAVADYQPSAAAREAARRSSRTGRLLSAAARAARDLAPGLCRMA